MIQYSACMMHVWCMYGACMVHIVLVWSIFGILYGANCLLCISLDRSGLRFNGMIQKINYFWLTIQYWHYMVLSYKFPLYSIPDFPHKGLVFILWGSKFRTLVKIPIFWYLGSILYSRICLGILLWPRLVYQSRTRFKRVTSTWMKHRIANSNLIH